MEEISRQLLYQRLRNRFIELLDMYSSLNDIATIGAYEMIELAYDLLPLNYDEAPKVFSKKEKEAISKFAELAKNAAEATEEDTWSIDWFKRSEEWVNVSEFAKQALVIFAERGRFSEEHEEEFAT